MKTEIAKTNTLSNADFDAKRLFFDEGNTLELAFRKKMLRTLRAGIEKHEDVVLAALAQDLRKSPSEAYLTEIGLVYNEIDHAIKNLKRWMRPKRIATPLAFEPSSSRVYRSPRGVVLIISPWNYPFQLCMAPLTSAIAAGNCIILKPSEIAPATALIIEKIIADTFESNYISTVLGIGEDVVPTLLDDHTFNHIYFTGSPAVGKIMAGLAAKKLVSTTLELGGKSPCIVHSSANLKVAAKRIAWGKFVNAGQTCIAPDYILVSTEVVEKLVVLLKAAIIELYGENPELSPDYPRIINDKRFVAISNLMNSGHVEHGGQTDRLDRYIAPTLLTGVNLDSDVMAEEIFGPVLPIINFDSTSQVIETVRRNRYPLSCYIFCNDGAFENLMTQRLEFGGACINNTLIQFANHDLPFGGIQGSGSGNGHGWYGFNSFSHTKSLMKSATWVDPSLKYPPYSMAKLKWLKKFLHI